MCGVFLGVDECSRVCAGMRKCTGESVGIQRCEDMHKCMWMNQIPNTV